MRTRMSWGASRPSRPLCLALAAAAAAAAAIFPLAPTCAEAAAAAEAAAKGAAASPRLSDAVEPPCSCEGGKGEPAGGPVGGAHPQPPADVSGLSREGVYFIPEPLPAHELHEGCDAEERGLPSCPPGGPPQGWGQPSSYTASLVFTPGGEQRMAAEAKEGTPAAAAAAAAAAREEEEAASEQQCLVDGPLKPAVSFEGYMKEALAAAWREVRAAVDTTLAETKRGALSPSSDASKNHKTEGPCLRSRAPTMEERRQLRIRLFCCIKMHPDRRQEFNRSALYEESRLLAIFKDLATHVFGNAHSRNPSANLTDQRTREARLLTLDFFGARQEEFAVVFTSGATAAIKLVGEDFPFTAESSFFYLRINHNSVLGVRELAYAAGVKAVKALSEAEVEALLSKREAAGLKTDWSETAGLPHCLFGFPLKDNFNGALYPSSWIEKIHKFGLSDGCRWHVLLDVAAAAPTLRIRLSHSAPEASADFLATSFYKIFGYPTGLGALVVKRSAAAILNKVYWGGGSVSGSLCDTRWQKLKKDVSARLEDGTALGMDKIERHVAALTRHLFRSLKALRHRNGAPFALVYWSRKEDPSGGVVAFNLLKPDGSFVPFGEVEAKTAAAGIHLRTGCFCNPGGCQDFLGLTGAEIVESTRARESCSDPNGALLNRSASPAGGLQLGLTSRAKAVGAVRVSMGYLSTFHDIDGLLDFLVHTFLWQ
ncbi:hypothetical protein Emed_004925 [Eimeria media]